MRFKFVSELRENLRNNSIDFVSHLRKSHLRNSKLNLKIIRGERTTVDIDNSGLQYSSGHVRLGIDVPVKFLKD